MLHDLEVLTPFMPTKCPACFSKLSIEEDLHLWCLNKICSGSGIKKLSKGLEVLDIKGLGPKMAEKLFQVGYHNIEDILDLEKFEARKLIDANIFKPGKSLDNAIEAISNINLLEFSKLIEAMQFADVGKELSKRLSKYFQGEEVDFSGMHKEATNRMLDINSEDHQRVKKVIQMLSNRGVEVKNKQISTENLITLEMTGSPMPFRTTKGDFLMSIKKFGYEHTSLTKDTKLLVTDDLSSTTGKMAKAKKFGTIVKTYEQLLQELGLL